MVSRVSYGMLIATDLLHEITALAEQHNMSVEDALDVIAKAGKVKATDGDEDGTLLVIERITGADLSSAFTD